MNFTQTGDLKFFYTPPSAADIRTAADKITLLRDPGLETAVLISLFSDARADEGETLPNKGDSRGGWWGSSLMGAEIGSKLWLLSRSKLTNTTTAKKEQYTRDALQWLIDDGVLDEVEVESRRAGVYRIDTAIKMIKQDTSVVFFKYFLNWQAQTYGGLL